MATHIQQTLKGIEHSLISIKDILQLIERIQHESSLEGTYHIRKGSFDSGFIIFDDKGVQQFSYQNKSGEKFIFQRLYHE